VRRVLTRSVNGEEGEWFMKSQPSNKTALARKNGSFGYKAVVRYAHGYTHTVVRKNFETREQALAYAQKWVEVNDQRPVGVRSEKVNCCNRENQ
jgi:hypothetical protein